MIRKGIRHVQLLIGSTAFYPITAFYVGAVVAIVLRAASIINSPTATVVLAVLAVLAVVTSNWRESAGRLIQVQRQAVLELREHAKVSLRLANQQQEQLSAVQQCLARIDQLVGLLEAKGIDVPASSHRAQRDREAEDRVDPPD